MRRKIKAGCAGALALVLFLSGIALTDVRAALEIDTARQCSVTFEVGGEPEGDFAELKALEIPVSLYRVASVDATGEYAAEVGFEDLKLEEINSETKAAEWEAKAKKAVEVIEKNNTQTPYQGTITGGTGTVDALPTGMYLVAAQKVESPEYEYQFTPYLLALPNNYYSESNPNDDWIYDVTTGLKTEREERFGSLIIDKTLSSFNDMLGSATFVFQIEGSKNGENVYSNVVSAVFDGAGSKSILVENIPACADVTVTEVYSGASYEVVGSASQTVKIVADPKEESGANAVHAAFTNQYNGQLNGGASVVNHFVNEDGNWTLEQQGDSTAK